MKFYVQHRRGIFNHLPQIEFGQWSVSLGEIFCHRWWNLMICLPTQPTLFSDFGPTKYLDNGKTNQQDIIHISVIENRRCILYTLSLISRNSHPTISFLSIKSHIAKLSGSQIKSWVVQSLLVVCLSVLSRIGDISTYVHYRISRPYKPYIMHVWWYLVVYGGVWTWTLMEIGWYDLTWCVWADIFSDACNRSTDAADTQLLRMRCFWCCWWCWCTDAAGATDPMMLLMRCSW